MSLGGAVENSFKWNPVISGRGLFIRTNLRLSKPDIEEDGRTHICCEC